MLGRGMKPASGFRKTCFRCGLPHCPGSANFYAMTLCVARVAMVALAGMASAALADPDHCSPDDPHAGTMSQSPDFTEAPAAKGAPTTQSVGPVTPAVGQPSGALSGRIVFTSGGHGWTADTGSWYLQRGVLLEMNEDYGNVDQMNFFADYCFNAGAAVVPMRPLGNQTNEVVLDNDAPGVTFAGAWSDSTSTIFYGSPGDVPYRFASLAVTETATATYTPNFPATGFYPAYTWVRHGSDRDNGHAGTGHGPEHAVDVGRLLAALLEVAVGSQPVGLAVERGGNATQRVKTNIAGPNAGMRQ